MDEKANIEKYLKDCSPFYQGGIELPYGLYTEAATKDKRAGDCRLIWKLLNLDVGRDIYEKEILDCCCNAGFYAMTCDELGAKKVDGFDASEEMIFAAKKFATWKVLTNTQFWFCTAESWEWSRKYDTVFFLQVLYHLDDPARYLKRALSACRGLIVLIVKDTLPWPEDELRMRLDDCDFQVEDRYPDPLAPGKVVVKGRRHERK